MRRKYKARTIKEQGEDLEEGAEAISEGLVGKRTRKRYKKKKYSL